MKVTLSRLSDDEYVDKTDDGYYHARADREDLNRYTAALDGLDRAFATREETQDDGDDTETPGDGEIESRAELATEEIEDAVELVDDAAGSDEG